ncbi:MAG: hypothetical protein PF569_03875 [Candidatus Woesearchaeota archaeon]|jgi:exonuclease SbcC|nr:hypothetical protein [Candidatus Woesearchaeota archaeon]
MRIDSITADGFKAYQGKRTFTFKKGANLILGRNGKGKSTIIDIINLLLFDKKPDKMESLCNYYNKENRFYINIKFGHEEHEYYIEMEYSKKGNTGTSKRSLYIDDKFVAENSDVNKFLNEVFNIEIMSYALISKQREAEIVECKDAERRELLKQVQNLDFSKKVKEHIEPVIKELQDQLTQIEKDIYLLENQTYTLSELPELPFLETEYESKVKEKESIVTILKELEGDIAQVNILKDNKQSLYNEITELKTEYSSIEETLQSIDNISSEEDKLNLRKDDLQNSLTDYQNNLKSYDLDKEKQDAESERQLRRVDTESMIKDHTQGFEEVMEAKVKRIKSFDQSLLDQKYKELTIAETNLKHLEKEISNIRSGNCPTCNRPWDIHSTEDKENDIKVLQKTISILNKEVKELETEKADIEAIKRKNDEVKEAKRIAESSIAKYTEEINRFLTQDLYNIDQVIVAYEAEIIECESKIKDIEHQIIILDKDIESLKDKANQADSYRNKLFSIDKSIKLKESKISSLEEKIAEIEKQTHRKDSLERSLSTLKSELSHYTKVKEDIERIKIANTEEEKKEKEDKKKLKKTHKDKDNTTQSIIDNKLVKDVLLKDFPNFVIDSKIDEIEYDMNKFINQIYDRDLGIEFKKNASSIKLLYGEGDRKISARGGTSGAERKIIQLAFINSFNKSLGLDCLLLDEPDESADDINAEAMYETMGGMNDIYGQTIYITHKEAMKTYLTTNFDINMIEI